MATKNQNSNQLINNGTDTATVSVTVNSVTEEINGTNGRDTINGSAEGDLINGLGARDILRGLGGNDTINGGQGNDNLQGGFNDDVLNGEAGNDLLIGTVGSDTLAGGEGSDRFRFFRPSNGVDEITDFDGSEDTIEIRGSNFSENLANGVLPDSQFVLGTAASDSDDLFLYDQDEGNLFFDADGNGSDNPVLLATLSNGAILSAEDIRIFGATPPNTPPQAVDDSATTLQNQAVNIDVLSNDSDADGDPLSLSIATAPSNGTAVIDDNGTPNNLLDDFISYIANTNFTGDDQFSYQIDDGNGGIDTATVSVTVNSTTTIINGTEGSDTLNGTSDGDLINGLGARDVLRGLGGKDTLNGGAGNDLLRGGFSSDVLNGDAGNDLLIGGFGNDTLDGGAGRDRFRFFRPNDGVDEITDFTSGRDSLQFKGNNFGGLATGNLDSSQFVLGTTAVDSDDRFIYNQSEGNLFFDVDGNGSNNPVLLLTLSDRANLSASDIRIF